MPRSGREAEIPVLDLFSGAGGLSLGLARAGMVPVAASEMDRDALETYVAAHSKYHPKKQLDVFEGDIAAQSFKKLRGNIAVVAGGPPCQPYSTGGLRRGILDVRDGLPQFFRVLQEVKPEAFLMENVPGLAKGVQLDRLSKFLNELAHLGFHVRWRVLHAADFGVSQRRQRLFVVGSRSTGFEWPDATHGPGTQHAWVTSKELLDPRNPVGDLNVSKVTYAKTPDLRPSPWDGHLWNGGGRPINPDGLVPTLLASMGGNKTPWLDGGGVVPGYHKHLMAGGHPRSGIVKGARRITAEEAARVQTFPADMPWSGRRSSRYRQIGNAVPVDLAHAVGVALHRHVAATATRGRGTRVSVA
ncbi:MAG: DNA (cytosine-5-)-methyltransferase [Fimbriimonadaceae bacterium]|nr:DNA (cytosine-5-)-methyltransferase [Fimbriimonadaceae bacterium]